MAILQPCINCGQPTNTTRCPACQTTHNRITNRGKPPRKKTTTAHQRGYTYRWQQLSKRARQLQPFCSDCGATDDLQCDHSPQAWERHNKGLAIRLKDVDVVCGECNRKRGKQRPDATEHSPGTTKRSHSPSKPSKRHNHRKTPGTRETRSQGATDVGGDP